MSVSARQLSFIFQTTFVLIWRNISIYLCTNSQYCHTVQLDRIIVLFPDQPTSWHSQERTCYRDNLQVDWKQIIYCLQVSWQVDCKIFWSQPVFLIYWSVLHRKENIVQFKNNMLMNDFWSQVVGKIILARPNIRRSVVSTYFQICRSLAKLFLLDLI